MLSLPKRRTGCGLRGNKRPPADLVTSDAKQLFGGIPKELFNRSFTVYADSLCKPT